MLRRGTGLKLDRRTLLATVPSLLAWPARAGEAPAALAAYEAAMFPRSKTEAVDAREILDICLGERAPFALIEFLARAAENPVP